MQTGRIIDLTAKSQEIKDNEKPAALIYFKERVPVRDWQELFFIAVKCLYAEFPDTINSLCSTDPTRNLFLRTNTIDMVSPKKIAPIIYLETNRTPQQILKAIRLIFSRADVHRPQMRIELVANYESRITNYNKKPVLHINQTIEEMLATLDAMEVHAPLYPENNFKVQIPTSKLFFVLEGERHGPFANEKNRYVALMQCLAELYPYQILKEAGHHINSMHRLTLMKGASYLYFREPVELPNNLFLDKDFPDRILIENERYYLARCGLYFESVMFGA